MHGFDRVVGRVTGALLVQGRHALDAVGDVELERLLAELFGEDQVVDRILGLAPLWKAAQKGEQEGQAGKPLLPIDDEPLPSFSEMVMDPRK